MKIIIQKYCLYILTVLSLLSFAGCSDDGPETGREEEKPERPEPEEPSQEEKTVIPQSIVIDGARVINFDSPDQKISVGFRVTPPEAVFKYSIETFESDVRLVYSRGNEAQNFSGFPVLLTSIQKSGEAGLYTAVLKDSGLNLFTYDEDVTLSLSFTDEKGERQSIESNSFNVIFDNGLPLIVDDGFAIFDIHTPGEITSKDDWMDDCSIEIANAGNYSKSYSKVQMKGRGNSTWWGIPKKPYAIKLDKKDEVMGFPKHKRWVLLANYYDHSNIRTEISFCMSRMSMQQSEPGMSYTPRTAYTRMFMNDEFQGLYVLTEQMKIDENRVDVGDDGYLLEIDFRAGEDPEDIYFKVPHISQPIVIKDPDMESQADIDYIKDFLTKVDEVLYSKEFTDAEKGYKNYIDVNSFVDWYLVNEITKNADASFYASCYMSFRRGEKLKMGPVWDFDLAMGNYPNFGDYYYTEWINKPQDFHIKNSDWIKRMFEDPEFVSLVKKRFRFYYDRRDEILGEIDRLHDLLLNVVHENDKVWHFYSRPYDADKTTKAFDDECSQIKEWLGKRFNWLRTEFDKM